MKKTISFILLSLACLSLSAQSVSQGVQQPAATLTAAQPVVRFGVVSYKAALEAMPEYANVQKEMGELEKKYEAEAKRSEADFNNKYEDFLEGQKDFPQTILLKRQTELQELMAKNVQFRQESRQLLDAARTDAMTPLYQKLNTMLKVIGEKEGFAFILNSDGDACPYFNASQGKDITQLVINALKN